jgi:hypothetical protein
VAEGAASSRFTPAKSARRFALWDFARGSWKYDLVVALILVFVFATPRSWFHDQPKAASIVLMSSDHGARRVFIATGLLASVSPAARPAAAQKLIHKRTGKSWHVVRVEPIHDQAEQEIKGFIAYTSP